MGYIEDALRLTWVNGLRETTRISSDSLRNWLDKRQYAVTTITPSGDSFVITDLGKQGALKAFSHDVNRMASASFESVAHIRVLDAHPKSLSWLAVKLYYAAFYSANTLLRMAGIAPTYLEKLELSKILGTSLVMNTTSIQKVRKGSYIATLDNGTLYFRKSDHGSHEVVWNEFLALLKTVLVRYKLSGSLSEDIKDMDDLFTAIINSMSQAGCSNGNWLSKVRNDINYRHAYGIWYPYDTNVDYRRIADLMALSGIIPSPSHISGSTELMSFVNLSSAIINICELSLFDMSSRCPRGQSFLKNGALDCMRLWKVA